jgi:hypothetical protein
MRSSKILVTLQNINEIFFFKKVDILSLALFFISSYCPLLSAIIIAIEFKM